MVDEGGSPALQGGEDVTSKIIPNQKGREGFHGRFKRLQEHFKRRPGSALRTLSADIDHIEVLHTFIKCNEHTVEADQPEGLGGNNKAPGPTQLLLSAVASCQAITLRTYSNGMGMELDDIKVKVTGTLDLRGYFSVPDENGNLLEPILEQITIKTYIESEEPVERIKELIQAIDGKGVCIASIRTKLPLRSSFRLNGYKLSV